MVEEAKEQEEAVEEEVQEAVYVSARYPKLKGLYLIPTDDEDKPRRVRFQLEKGVLRLRDPAHIAAMDQELARNTGLSACVQKLDFASAEQTVRSHQAVQASRKGAVKGPFTSDSMVKMGGQERLHVALGAESSPDAVAAVQKTLAEDGLEIPDDVKPVQQIPDPEQTPKTLGFLKK